jgi:hypothetical protein
MDEACAVCMQDVPLASLDACSHFLCIDCAVAVARGHAVCPICRVHFTSALQRPVPSRGIETIQYDVQSNSLLPWFPNITALCMGIASKLIFDSNGYDDGSFQIHLPEYLLNMPGCDECVCLEEGDSDRPDHIQFFDEMREAVMKLQHLPMIVTRITVGRYVEQMIERGFFEYTDVCLCDTCKSDRVAAMDPNDVSEEEGGYKTLMMEMNASEL